MCLRDRLVQGSREKGALFGRPFLVQGGRLVAAEHITIKDRGEAPAKTTGRAGLPGGRRQHGTHRGGGSAAPTSAAAAPLGGNDDGIAAALGGNAGVTLSCVGTPPWVRVVLPARGQCRPGGRVADRSVGPGYHTPMSSGARRGLGGISRAEVLQAGATRAVASAQRAYRRAGSGT